MDKKKDAPTASQLAAITAIDEHVLVAAGAGTGKTSTVVGRILYLLGVPIEGRTIAEPLQLRDIAAITYTNAAAADLKRKLREKLREADRRDEAYEIDGARIGTIHGFCGAILREFALRMRGNPGARVMEEGESSALAAECVHENLLTVLEKQSIPDLDELFSQYDASKVKEWATTLVGDSARLRRFAERRDTLDRPTRALVDFAVTVQADVQRRLLEAGALDFDRMIVWTHDLLRSDESVRRALQRRIRSLIVDEFQDVDPTQRDIAFLLGAPAERRADTTRLMLVGDPKQSIYRFRRADVTVWTGVQRDFQETGLGRVIALEENFRSVPAIVGFVDASVGAVLDIPGQPDTARADFEVDYQPLKATREAQPGVTAVELLTLEGAQELKLNVAASRTIEAAAIAQRMKELNAGGAHWRDMAILLTAWGSLEIYEGALRDAKIPSYALLAEGYYERREILDMVLALETLRDPRDDRALLGFLRSPFVGVRDETLLDLVRQTTRPVWSRIAEARVAEQALVDFGVSLVRDHAALRDRISINELLVSLLDRSGYLAHLVALGETGRQPLANVRKFLRFAREFRDGNVGDFLRAVREAKKREEQESDERLYGRHEDVVTITSVHSAKGLEWPIVFWADLAREPSKVGNQPLLIGRDTVALKNPEAEAQGPAWTELLEQEKAEAAAEHRRLWYVAATRAKDRLIVSGFTDKKTHDGCAATALNRVLGLDRVTGSTLSYRDRSGTEFHATIQRLSAVEESETTREMEFTPTAVPAAPAAVHALNGRPRHSATELMGYARCPRRHWFKYVIGVREPPMDRSGPEWGSAVARGQVVHDVLEHIREEDELEGLLEVALGRWDPDRPPPESEPGRQYRDALAREISAVRGHPAYRALDDAPGSRRELEFVHLASGDGFLQGKIDLAAAGEAGFEALDVKTGGGDRETLQRKADGYALQRSVYVGALQAVGGKPVASFAFHFAADGVQIGGPLTDEMRSSAAADVRQALSAMGGEEIALTQHPAECRFCGFRRVNWCEGVKAS
jgi:ATP-dependent helicase/nuclease subunit A